MSLSSDLVYIAVVDGGFQCYRVVNGRYKQFVGVVLPKPRTAIRYADNLEAVPVVSPLRPKQSRSADQ